MASSIHSEGVPDPPFRRALLAAATTANGARITELLSESRNGVSSDRYALRHALQRVAAKGDVQLCRLLLDRGAEVNVPLASTGARLRTGTGGSNESLGRATTSTANNERTIANANAGRVEVSALVRAVEGKHADVVRLLLSRGADPNARDKLGRTGVFIASLAGRLDILRLLLAHQASLATRDRENRTVLICLAQERRDIDPEIIQLLLAHGASLQATDAANHWADTHRSSSTSAAHRTPLLWASANGNAPLVQAFLDASPPADIRARTDRGRTALHLAAQNGHTNVISFLLSRGADPMARSDGGWLAHINAAEKGHLPAMEVLLAHPRVDVNAALHSGMTALHIGAHFGHAAIVKAIIAREGAKLWAKDAAGMSPMLRAALRGHWGIVRLLNPARQGDRLTAAQLSATARTMATVVDFGHQSRNRNGKRALVFKHTVWELLYRIEKTPAGHRGPQRTGGGGGDDGDGEEGAPEEEADRPYIPLLPSHAKTKPDFRWIHIPANNTAWMEALLGKYLVEAGERGLEGFKVLEDSFAKEHRGPTVHSKYMRTSVTRASRDDEDRLEARKEGGNGAATVPLRANNHIVPPAAGQDGDEGTTETSTKAGGSGSGRKKSKDEKGHGKHKGGAKAEHASASKGGDPKAGRGQRGRNNMHQGRPGDGNAAESAGEAKSSNMVLFMPYLHYETDEKRVKMAKAIRTADAVRSARPGELPHNHLYSTNLSADEVMIRGYLHGDQSLHIRRTLDQFFYHGIDTEGRDRDQVVWRYCRRRQVEPKVFMVDQLWIYVIGDLVVTSFPQRYEEEPNDPLNVLNTIIEDMDAKNHARVHSVEDLVLLITSRCISVFDRNRVGSDEYQFLDMFESSIGFVTNRESELFARFNRASAHTANWLKTHRRRTRGAFGRSGPAVQDDGLGDNVVFVDALLDIGTETRLLAEIKDIRDELNIITMVLEHQLHVLEQLATIVYEEAGGGGRRAGRADRTDRAGRAGRAIGLRNRAEDQIRTAETHRRDVLRMDKQAEGIYLSLTHLLDLKQKHANAFEARFARAQAVLTARQGQTIMAFTIVTIVFLPMSFIAAFFAIPMADLGELRVGRVAQYLFGIGLAISIPLVALAFSIDELYACLTKLSRAAARFVLRWTDGSNKNNNNSSSGGGNGASNAAEDDQRRRRHRRTEDRRHRRSSRVSIGRWRWRDRLTDDDSATDATNNTDDDDEKLDVPALTMLSPTTAHGRATPLYSFDRPRDPRSFDSSSAARFSPVSPIALPAPVVALPPPPRDDVFYFPPADRHDGHSHGHSGHIHWRGRDREDRELRDLELGAAAVKT